MSADRDLFYKEIAKPVVEEVESQLFYTYFNLHDTEKLLQANSKQTDNKLALYYKVLSPRHLLKEKAKNDSNQLNKEFYNELLHIIGLEEIKDGSKKRIDRKKKDSEEGSLLENTINILKTRNKLHGIENLNQFGEEEEEQVFSVALELCITWLNRILFLKLLEGQLITYHRKDPSFAFLNAGKIADFDELDELFFEVLAVPQANRTPSVVKKFGNIPYLNSSLFEISPLEGASIRIADLKDRLELSIYSGTVFRNDADKRPRGNKNTLQYLFEFLNAFDFASEDTENVVVETKKDVINASVLGLIFEKINGYKDGSFFTPGFITEYMCRESLRRAVAQKFKEHEPSIDTFEDVKSYVHKYFKKDDLVRFNKTVNSLKVCDPAVGSGHFLVSALNELLAIKSELGILLDADGQPLEYLVKIEHDTLIVTHRATNEPFNYLLDKDGTPPPALQKVQHALFHEKQTLIEGSLFGVDINPKSVMICRLRLWIELLKHAYYKQPTKGEVLELQTLPNIDINIKNGNSLVSRFKTDFKITDFKNNRLRESFLRKFKQYSVDVFAYKECKERSEKESIRKRLGEFQQFINELFKLDLHEYKAIKKLEEEMGQTGQSFDFSDKDKTFEGKVNKLQEKIEKANEVLQEKLKIYQNAFEWRFEFPEVLNDNGDFIGFDAVIGNPPYVSLQKIKDSTKLYSNQSFDTFTKLGDLYCLFYERGINVLKEGGNLTFITSNSWLKTQYGEPLRKFFIEKSDPKILVNIEDTQIFEEATVESNILVTEKSTWSHNLKASTLNTEFSVSMPIKEYVEDSFNVIDNLEVNGWIIGDARERDLKKKIETGSKLLGAIDVTIYRGVTTGANDAFYIDERIKNILIKEDPKSSELIKAAIRGRDIQKYEINKDDLYLIFTRRGIDIDEYKAVKNYLLQFKEALVPKPDDWDEDEDGEWKGRKSGSYKWYEIQDNTAYYEEFDKEKIVWGEIADGAKFSFDESKLYGDATLFIMTGPNLKYILGILNSNLSNWYFNQISTTTGMGTNRWKKYKIEQLPIKDVSAKERKPLESLVDRILSLKKEDPSANTSELEKEIDELVYNLYNLTADEIKIIEGK